MYITNKTKQYPCTGYFPTAQDVLFAGVEGVVLPLTGEIKLYRDDGFELATQICENYARQTCENEILLLTNKPIPIPQPVPPAPQPTETEKLRADVDFLAVITGVTI